MHTNQFAAALQSDHELTKALIEGFGALFQDAQEMKEGLSLQKTGLPEVIYLGGPEDVQ